MPGVLPKIRWATTSLPRSACPSDSQLARNGLPSVMRRDCWMLWVTSCAMSGSMLFTTASCGWEVALSPAAAAGSGTYP